MVYDLIIIGSDAAGLTAGLYAGRKKLNTVILTKKLGGQSLYTDRIENFPGFLTIAGAELVSKIKEQVDKFGVAIEEGKEVIGFAKDGQFFIIKTSEDAYRAKAIIVATGSHWRSLGVPGEKEYMGKGVSICAICDAPFYKDKDVAVVGGGNSAFESAQDLLDYANKIYLLQHRDKFIGDKSVQTVLEKSGKVEFITNAETREIVGAKTVESLVYEDLLSQQKKELKVDGVFVNIGLIPNSAFAENFLKLNERKEIVIDPKTNSTSVEGVFAAGDVTDIKYKQFVVAAAEGAKAALSAFKYLRN